jgi:hypothetical protein
MDRKETKGNMKKTTIDQKARVSKTPEGLIKTAHHPRIKKTIIKEMISKAKMTFRLSHQWNKALALFLPSNLPNHNAMVKVKKMIKLK